ncbi:MAG TPA: YncE family protein [Candidatus Polarisedimenticolia bacterium]|nr:YncE family protein [Candidatus Polarisedimenticolia bacterium]
MRPIHRIGLIVANVVVLSSSADAQYVNFESSQVHPIDLTPSGGRLLAVNTPDALLEVFTVAADGSLTPERAIPVGLEPVTVVARTDGEAWVVNNLSDTVSVVDLDLGTVSRTLVVGDEPTDVVFASGKAFVAVSQEDHVKVFNLTDLAQPPGRVDLFGRDVRALAASPDGTRVYAVVLQSGNQTAIINANDIWSANNGLVPARLLALGLNNTACPNNIHPPYPPHPAGIPRNLALPDPPGGQQPPVSLIVKWDTASGRYLDDAGQDWTSCLPFRLADHDLFVIDALNPTTAGVVTVDHLGTSLFEVSVNPVNGRVYLPHTEARNQVRFEHALGVRGHMVDNRIAVVNPTAGNSVRIVDLNQHIDRASNPSTNLSERLASLSQPGMMVWNAAGTQAWLTAIGSRKVFRLSQACLNGAGPDYGACIFGTARAVPDAVEVSEGPSGVALREGATPRLYVLSRFANAIDIVDPAGLTRVGTVRLHDPSSATILTGRRRMYDGIDSSQHGDAACSSCHLSGDRDNLAWDLGDPTGSFTAYGTPGDNVRFFPVDDPGVSAAHAGFDPEKGPMTTQTLRGMLEPLHWRGDRGTMDAFNKAFVGLMGTTDIGPVNGEPAGLNAAAMEEFRQFALGMAFPPNPYRNVDDTIPNAVLTIPGLPNPGNPFIGQQRFVGTLGTPTDGPAFCNACHQAPFGAAGGQLGGVNPGDPPLARAALFNGDLDLSPHSDLKVPHLRNMYEKFGPRFANLANPNDQPADQKSGFGLTHDGSIPDLNTFLSVSVFSLTPDDVKNISAFTMLFPTGTRPAVGRNVTLPAGAPPTGTAAQESLLQTLVAIGNLADLNRHCELVAAGRSGGPGARERTWFLSGGAPGGFWTSDTTGEAPVSTATLRTNAGGPITFTCATRGSGVRMGADRDEDGTFNGGDCAPGDAQQWQTPSEVTGLFVTPAAHLAWDAQVSVDPTPIVYDVAGANLSTLASGGLGGAGCLSGTLASPAWDDARPAPPVGDGYYYLVRAKKPCGSGGFGGANAALDALACSP